MIWSTLLIVFPELLYILHVVIFVWLCIMMNTLDVTLGQLQNIDLDDFRTDLRPANERRRYKVTPSLIGWAQT